jgi:cyclopropane fatty-acyl-phospholipid synthase-like methyltransferase
VLLARGALLGSVQALGFVAHPACLVVIAERGVGVGEFPVQRKGFAVVLHGVCVSALGMGEEPRAGLRGPRIRPLDLSWKTEPFSVAPCDHRVGYERVSVGDVEQQVRKFYDTAGPAYEALMGAFWHHGDLEAEAAGLSPTEAAKALEGKLIAASGLEPGGWALDFGSGVGGATVHMAAISGANFVGLSNNEGLSERARNYAREQGLAETVAFHTIGDEDYRRLGAWPDGTFDAVSFLESVCHLPAKGDFFRSAFRVLKPGGRLVGIDWLQRPFGEHRTDERIARWMEPVERHISIPWHGTVASYREMIEAAGFEVEVAVDLYDGVECWGSTPPNDAQGWLEYEDDQFQAGKRALDAARAAGVFTVGQFVAVKR